eukprot:Cvel_572.t1-p1 / transcript=Cvel_572.t1 / gene=Cvel_572 / organism=Chromera_velia_CCMP2878 / gene_product=hypothetical protein / transcript_product=hypothetical protein / location=Cvel_scaffold17:198929-201290(-) / protein_length=290 / sequence_SO=supercontig / SO=protein_coding / is_pseudo=false
MWNVWQRREMAMLVDLEEHMDFDRHIETFAISAADVSLLASLLDMAAEAHYLRPCKVANLTLSIRRKQLARLGLARLRLFNIRKVQKKEALYDEPFSPSHQPPHPVMIPLPGGIRRRRVSWQLDLFGSEVRQSTFSEQGSQDGGAGDGEERMRKGSEGGDAPLPGAVVIPVEGDDRGDADHIAGRHSSTSREREEDPGGGRGGRHASVVSSASVSVEHLDVTVVNSGDFGDCMGENGGNGAGTAPSAETSSRPSAAAAAGAVLASQKASKKPPGDPPQGEAGGSPRPAWE